MQIQRIQTVYIFLALVAMIIFIFVPYGAVTHVGDNPVSCESLMTYSEFGILIPAAAAAILLFIDIFLYRNLALQRKVLNICLLLTLCCIAVTCFTLFKEADAQGLEAMFTWWDVLLPVAVIFEILGLSGIIHDIKLLKSYDRLR